MSGIRMIARSAMARTLKADRQVRCALKQFTQGPTSTRWPSVIASKAGNCCWQNDKCGEGCEPRMSAGGMGDQPTLQPAAQDYSRATPIEATDQAAGSLPNGAVCQLRPGASAARICARTQC